MRKFIIYPAIVLFLIISACKKENNPETEPDQNSNSNNKIMPLGASRVEGGKPEFESYRYDLWKKLVDGGWDFDFIGTMDDDSGYSDYSGKAFDTDHEGRGGWTSGEILDGINGWLSQTGAPDIVLFSSPGGNDALNGELYDQAIININAIVDAIQAVNPNVTIIIEQLAPARSDAMTPELTTFFNQMQVDVVDIASAQTTATSSVITVDMATGFTDAFFADDVHYNAEGASFIANRYYEVLDDVLK